MPAPILCRSNLFVGWRSTRQVLRLDVFSSNSRFRPGFLDPSCVSSLPVAEVTTYSRYSSIDRWAAIWQAAHPDKWFTNGQDAAQQGSLPFQSPDGAFWNHNQVRDTTVFGNDYIDARGAADDVKTRFRSLYAWSVRSTQPDQQFKTPPTEMQPLPIQYAQVYQYADSEVPPVGGPGPAIGHMAQTALHVVSRAAEPITTTLAAAINDNLTLSQSSPAIPPSGDTKAIDTAPVAPGSHEGKAFTNMPENAVDAAPASIDEKKYLRDWYIDNIVQRYVRDNRLFTTLVAKDFPVLVLT